MQIDYDKQFFKKLKSITKPFANLQMQQEFKKALLLIVRYAKINAPRSSYSMGIDELKKQNKVSGRLRSSITLGKVIAYGDSIEGSVGTNVSYAIFQEFGTGKNGAATFSGDLPNNYKHGSVAGIKAKMFLTNTRQQVLENDLIPMLDKKMKEIWG